MAKTMTVTAVFMQQILPMIILCLTLILIGVPETQGATENTNNNGNISWADLPEGQEYSAQSEYDEGSFPLPSTWDAIDGFLKMISPAEPPYGK